MLQLEQVRFSYPDSAFRLELPTLEIGGGEHTALVGPSGCGKTTLLNLLAGVLLPDEGSIHVGDTEIQSLGDAQRRAFRLKRLGLVFQSFELLDYLDALDNILLPLRIGGLALSAAHRERARSLAEQLGIGDKLRRHPAALSQGERQRVAVCRALLLEPSLVLADEPTGNLDPANKLTVLDLLLDYARQHGATVVAATHDEALLPRFDRVLAFDALNAWRPS